MQRALQFLYWRFWKHILTSSIALAHVLREVLMQDRLSRGRTAALSNLPFGGTYGTVVLRVKFDLEKASELIIVLYSLFISPVLMSSVVLSLLFAHRRSLYSINAACTRMKEAQGV
jgi:hypothetical protein